MAEAARQEPEDVDEEDVQDVEDETDAIIGPDGNRERPTWCPAVCMGEGREKLPTIDEELDELDNEVDDEVDELDDRCADELDPRHDGVE